MEVDTGQSPLPTSSMVGHFLSTLCLGWYAVHWFVQFVGMYAASVDFPPRDDRPNALTNDPQPEKISLAWSQVPEKFSPSGIPPRSLDSTSTERT
jgi:hypothetical protein